MTSGLRPVLILAGGTGLSIVVGILTTKVVAVLGGAAGVADVALLQAVAAIAALVFSLGTGAGVVRLRGSGNLSDGSVWSAGMLVSVVSSGAGTLLLIVLSAPIATAALVDRSAAAVIPIALALPPLVLVNYAQGWLSTDGRVGAVAASVGAASLCTGTTVAAAMIAGRSEYLPLAILAGAVASLAVTTILVLASSPPRVRGGSATAAAVRRLLGFGVPYTASQLAGTGVQLLIPVIVLNVLDASSVALVRAATTVAVGYLALLLAAWARDFYPRVAAAEDRDVGPIISAQLDLVARLGIPLVYLVAASAPWLILVLFSTEFTGAVDILGWMLVGDLLKLMAWSCSFAVLARASARDFLWIELAGGAALLLAVPSGAFVAGPVGVGIAYAGAYAAYLVVVWMTVRRVTPLRLTRAVLLTLAACLVLVVVQSVRGGLPAEGVALLVLAAGAGFAFASARLLPAAGAAATMINGAPSGLTSTASQEE